MPRLSHGNEGGEMAVPVTEFECLDSPRNGFNAIVYPGARTIRVAA